MVRMYLRAAGACIGRARRQWRFRSIALVRSAPLALLMLSGGSLLGAAPAFFPLRDVHAGLHGVGRTVFQGKRIEEFQVEILGVLKNAGPAQSIILAKLSGGPLAEAGVIQGMSGSPVYIDGKLVGAVALGFAFSKEPIAGIQPIEQMIADARFDGERTQIAQASFGHLPNPLLAKASEQQPSVVRPFGSLTQLSTPLAFTGFTAATMEAFGSQFRKLGFEPQQGVSSGLPSSQQISGTVQPGSMISVGLLSGDMSISADGTVTYVDGKRVYAFGHRFLDNGSTELPFAASNVLAILPNLNTSFKLSSPQGWLGTIVSDRSTAIAGEVGRRANTIPVRIAVNAPGPKGTHEYHVQVVNDRLLTPFITQTALASAIDATERTTGLGTLQLAATVNFNEGLPPLVVRDIFVSDNGLAQQAALNAVVPLSFFLSAGFQSAQVKDMSFELRPLESKRQLYVTQAWTSAHQARPGDTVQIEFTLAGENGVSHSESIPFRIPVGSPQGALNFTVSDANTLNWPDFGGMNAASAGSAFDLIRMLNEYRGSEKAYIRIWRPETSFTINGPSPGGEISDPPPSASLILADPSSSPQANTASQATRGSAVAELNIAVPGFVITGAKTVQVDVRE